MESHISLSSPLVQTAFPLSALLASEPGQSLKLERELKLALSSPEMPVNSPLLKTLPALLDSSLVQRESEDALQLCILTKECVLLRLRLAPPKVEMYQLPRIDGLFPVQTMALGPSAVVIGGMLSPG